MATLVLQTLSGSGEITMAAATVTGDLVPNLNGRTILKVTNGGASAITVSATAVVPCDQGEKHNLSKAIDAGDTVDIVLDKRLNSQTTGNVSIAYTAVDSVTVGAYEVRYRS